MRALKQTIAVVCWELLVAVGGRGTMAIYGFGDGSWPHRLAGRIMMSAWWPDEDLA